MVNSEQMHSILSDVYSVYCFTNKTIFYKFDETSAVFISILSTSNLVALQKKTVQWGNYTVGGSCGVGGSVGVGGTDSVGNGSGGGVGSGGGNSDSGGSIGGS